MAIAFRGLLYRLLIFIGIFFLGLIDYKTGYELSFFAFYFAPVVAAAWYVNFKFSVGVSITCAAVWISADYLSGHIHPNVAYACWNTGIRLLSFLLLSWSVAGKRKLMLSTLETTAQLKHSLSEIKVLKSFLPICATCKKIRDEDGKWHSLEDYLMENTNTHLSHSYCPFCSSKTLEQSGLTPKRTVRIRTSSSSGSQES